MYAYDLMSCIYTDPELMSNMSPSWTSRHITSKSLLGVFLRQGWAVGVFMVSIASHPGWGVEAAGILPTAPLLLTPHPPASHPGWGVEAAGILPTAPLLLTPQPPPAQPALLWLHRCVYKLKATRSMQCFIWVWKKLIFSLGELLKVLL